MGSDREEHDLILLSPEKNAIHETRADFPNPVPELFQAQTGRSLARLER